VLITPVNIAELTFGLTSTEANGCRTRRVFFLSQDYSVSSIAFSMSVWHRSLSGIAISMPRTGLPLGVFSFDFDSSPRESSCAACDLGST